MALVVLGTDSLTTWMMVNALRQDHQDIHVIIENKESRYLFMKRRLSHTSWIDVFGQALFMLLYWIIRRLSMRRINLLISSAKLNYERPPGIRISYVETVNSDECINLLSKEDSRVVVLNGTRIVSRKVLQSCDAVFLNLHCGITPAYRGVHGGYWALFSGDFQNSGVTIHQVDPGIDTGDILYQERIGIEREDNVTIYPIKQYVTGIPLMLRAVSDAWAGKLIKIKRTDLPSAIWYHPTIWQYVSGIVFKKVF